MDQLTCVKSVFCSDPSYDPRSGLVDDDMHVIPFEELGPIVVVSPHPDDESLGCGGLIARCASLAVPVTVLAMTDGEASHPGDRAWRVELASIRKREQRNALKVLGLVRPDIVSLGLPDGGLHAIEGQMRERIVALIQDVVQSRMIRSVFVPAVDDRHDDHRETAMLIAEVVRRCPVEHVFSYQIWPPEKRSARVQANETRYHHDISDLQPLKQRAIHEHQSQFAAPDLAHAEGFQIPPDLLEAKLKNKETYALVSDVSAWSA
ncbi:PIG-L deacetylase family protein [Marinobacter fonticola]|uniref:PIG-L deacetylase family protein n=1 Tax=Marinobacter fonticola TaxID=2603215 RepID=UPI0011E68AB3|nr:PIG-L deacetylase family protein [Marinobacter fonticola]